MHKSKNLKSEILHYVQNDKKRRFVILEELKATKDLGLCKGLIIWGVDSGVIYIPGVAAIHISQPESNC